MAASARMPSTPEMRILGDAAATACWLTRRIVRDHLGQVRHMGELVHPALDTGGRGRTGSALGWSVFPGQPRGSSVDSLPGAEPTVCEACVDQRGGFRVTVTELRFAAPVVGCSGD